MLRIDEWKPPAWVNLEWEAIPPEPGKVPKRAPRLGAPAAPGTARAIAAKLESLQGRPACAVHFYEGEGLRWIRVGFDPGEPLQPAAVANVGRAIASCIPDPGPLYFHALRPHDLLFFLTGGDVGKIGMTARNFGMPLDEVLLAWGI